MKCLLLALVILLSTTPSFAQAVGPNCKLGWVPPTTHTDGTPLAAGELTSHRIYVDKPVITPGVTPPTLTIAMPTTAGVQICTTLAAGNHTVAVSSVTGPNEGPASAQFPFVLATGIPASPSSLQVQP